MIMMVVFTGSFIAYHGDTIKGTFVPSAFLLGAQRS
jgi:hypothetical protein